MKKILATILSAAILCSIVSAQAYEGSIDFEKKKQAAIVINYNYPQEAVEGAMVEKLEKLGLVTKEEKGIFNASKGFRTYKGAIIKDITSNSMDYSFKVTRKGNDASTLYLIILHDGGNVVADKDNEIIEGAKSFLEGMQPEVEAFNLELQIKDQEETLTKAEKKLKGLQDDQTDMEKKIKKLQDDLKENAKDQQDQQKEIEKQRQVLDAMKGKRKS